LIDTKLATDVTSDQATQKKIIENLKVTFTAFENGFGTGAPKSMSAATVAISIVE
jgi:hypothetical protein